jgi:L-ascorbate metabolism protein UlaG (beta-lactamase superfamily)
MGGKAEAEEYGGGREDREEGDGAVIEPVLSDEAFLADVQAVGRRDELVLWWLGQSGFLLRQGGPMILLDPYLSDSLTRKYAATDKPHVRMSCRVVDPSRLNFVEIVTSSHNHTDHLDPDTLLPIFQGNAPSLFVVAAANRQFVDKRLPGVADKTVIVELDDGHAIRPGWCTITAIASAHESLDRDELGRHPYLGYVIRAGRWTVYHSGDTILYDGMVGRLRPFNIDVAILPINGRAPERRVAGNLWGREAAWLAKEIGAKLVIPCHYDMFEFNTATPDEFIAECERLKQPYRVLQQGERWSSQGMSASIPSPGTPDFGELRRAGEG